MHFQKIKLFGWNVKLIIDGKKIGVCVSGCDGQLINKVENVINFEDDQILDSNILDEDITSTAWQRNSAISACESRINSKFNVTATFRRLKEELARIDNGKVIYD
jgi:hypothetical protein